MQIATITSVGSGVCWCHPPISPIPMTGLIITGAAKTDAEGKAMSRITDILIGNCGHIGMIITGSSKIETEGLSQARVTDQFIGCFQGVIVTGCVRTEGI